MREWILEWSRMMLDDRIWFRKRWWEKNQQTRNKHMRWEWEWSWKNHEPVSHILLRQYIFITEPYYEQWSLAHQGIRNKDVKISHWRNKHVADKQQTKKKIMPIIAPLVTCGHPWVA